MIKIAIVGYGHVGRFVLEAVQASNDLECVGIVRRIASSEGFPELEKYNIVSDIASLGKVDVAILAIPSREVKENALKCIAKGICTVDSFDIHAGICDLRSTLDSAARNFGVASIISAGWDPGTDSIVRALLQMMAPQGTSYTNFGPGRSMGHSVAAKAVTGVKEALSMTLPVGKGVHSRHVYIELEDGADFEEVAAAIKNDSYFAHDNTEVEQVESIAAINNMMHGVNLVREGISGMTDKQQFGFTMRINNPALTGQILSAAARAVVKLQPGCYTMIEIPMVDYLEGDRDTLIRQIV